MSDLILENELKIYQWQIAGTEKETDRDEIPGGLIHFPEPIIKVSEGQISFVFTLFKP